MLQLQRGERLGSYRIQQYLGRGGFGYVYLAEDSQAREVALKVGDVAGGGKYVRRFRDITDQRSPEWISPDEVPAEVFSYQRTGAKIDFLDIHEVDDLIRLEAEEMDGVRSQNYVRVRDLFEHDGRPVMVMDYVKGKTLREKIRNYEGIRFDWFCAMTRALQETKPHGDLKPENIIIQPSGGVVMIDRGVTKTRPTRGGEQRRTHQITTPHYNAQLDEGEKADVSGMGTMLYEIFTGILPFDDVPWHYAGRQQVGEVERLSLSYFLSYPPPSELNPNTPEPFEDLVHHCLTVPDYGYEALERDLAALKTDGQPTLSQPLRRKWDEDKI